ncbi:hypothetical protein LINPERPRIM_LOCUS20019, partial [Linum perenne]
RKRAKCLWDRIDKPLEEGGLGVHCLYLWNTACIVHHLWAIIMRGESLWIAWIHTLGSEPKMLETDLKNK